MRYNHFALLVYLIFCLCDGGVVTRLTFLLTYFFRAGFCRPFCCLSTRCPPSPAICCKATARPHLFLDEKSNCPIARAAAQALHKHSAAWVCQEGSAPPIVNIKRCGREQGKGQRSRTGKQNRSGAQSNAPNITLSC